MLRKLGKFFKKSDINLTLNQLVRVESLKKYFPVERGFLARIFSKKGEFIHAVDGISFEIKEGETFGLVGESGCGKSTTGRLVLRLIEPTEGNVYFENQNLSLLGKKGIKEIRNKMNMVFQNPYASLNPRMTIMETINEPLKLQSSTSLKEQKEFVIELLDNVGLRPPSYFIDRYPHELSGGERQRVVFARAVALRPKFIVADEPVASLDASFKTQILNLMRSLKESLGLTYLLIAHNIAVVKYLSNQIAVMYLGKIVEQAQTEDLFKSPEHPYTRALISAFTFLDGISEQEQQNRVILKGEITSPINLPSGCRFHPRCPFCLPECKKEEPKLIEIETGHRVACWRVIH